VDDAAGFHDVACRCRLRGHGTLCGALGGASLIINLVAYGEKNEIARQMIDRLFYKYADLDFPTDRFDDISRFQAGQVKRCRRCAHLGLEVDVGRGCQGNVQGEKRTLRQGDRRSRLHRHKPPE